MKKHLLLIGNPDSNPSGFLLEFITCFQDDTRFDVRILAQQQTEGTFDVAIEQAAIDAAESVVMHFPIYWYSMPAMLKWWVDSVFTFGWAFDENGGCMQEKPFLSSVTTGSSLESYSAEGSNLRSLSSYLHHVERTADYAGFNYLGVVATDQTRSEQASESALNLKEAICDMLGISAAA